MRILYISERPPYPFFLGGAARCAHEIMFSLVQNQQAECKAVGDSAFSNPPWSFPESEDYAALDIVAVNEQGASGEIDCHYPVQVIENFTQQLANYIDMQQPDIIWAQMEGAAFVVEQAYKKNIHSVLFVHDAEFDVAELIAISRQVSGIVCSSRFLANKVKKASGVKAEVVYPCPKTDFGVKGDPEGFLTMINPHAVKGFATFLDIARALPEEKFLLVESWKLDQISINALTEQLESLPNVKFIRRVSDMSEVYRQTRLLLVPSRWEEGFGMVAVEAQSCGIPVIASMRGGLPESVGEGGVLIKDYQNKDAWLKEIGRVLRDADYYAALSKLAYQHAHNELLSTQGSARRFLNFCNALLTQQVGRVSRTSLVDKIRGFIKR